MNTKTIHVADATPTQLNWLVAKCEGATKLFMKDGFWYVHFPADLDCDIPEYYEYLANLDYTENWSMMGPIIEREGIDVRFDRDRVFDPGEKVERWYASKPFDTIPDAEWVEYGPTSLIAAARCYVLSKLGEEVEVPEELV
jgi:hypothetical protein